MLVAVLITQLCIAAKFLLGPDTDLVSDEAFEMTNLYTYYSYFLNIGMTIKTDKDCTAYGMVGKAQKVQELQEYKYSSPGVVHCLM